MMHVLPSSPQNIKGLGRSEQGATDHVKVRVKNDSYGLGANASYEVSTFTILIQHCLTLVMHGNILWFYWNIIYLYLCSVIYLKCFLTEFF